MASRPSITVTLVGGPQHGDGTYSRGKAKCWEHKPRHIAMEAAFLFGIDNPLKQDVTALKKAKPFQVMFRNRIKAGGSAKDEDIKDFLASPDGKTFQTQRRYIRQTGKIGWNIQSQPPAARRKTRIEFEVEEFFELTIMDGTGLVESLDNDEQWFADACATDNRCALQGQTTELTLQFGSASAPSGGGLFLGFIVPKWRVLENGSYKVDKNGQPHNYAKSNYPENFQEKVDFTPNAAYPAHKWGYTTGWIDHCPCETVMELTPLSWLDPAVKIYRPGTRPDGMPPASGPTVYPPGPVLPREAGKMPEGQFGEGG